MEFERIWNGPGLRVDHLDGEGDDLVIAFSSVGHDVDRPPSPEFVATATGRGTKGAGRRALFVLDEGRSWASDPQFETALLHAVTRLNQRQPVLRIATIGLSMGAYCALAAAQLLPVSAVLAFGPQYSVLPDLVPGEGRWAEWTVPLLQRQGLSMRWPVAPLPQAPGCHAWLFHGAEDDLPHALRFPDSPQADQLIFPGLSHSGLVPHLKKRGLLPGLMEAALAGDRRRLLRIASGAGGTRRERLFPRQAPEEG